jgi:CHAD domain-containing protein
MTAGDAIRDAIARSVHRLLAHDPGVRLGDDPEFVHQARVATRRLRSDLRTFRSLVDPEWARGLRDELRWIAAALGAVRDTEVLLELLREKASRLPAVDRPVADQFLGVLVGRWEEERIELLGAMRSARYVRLLDRLVDAAREPRFASPRVGEPARAVLAPLVRGPWSHLRKAVEALDDHPPDGALHGVRIRAKRCRYAAEAVAPVVGGPARRFARRLAALQDVLGRHHDAVVAAAWLREVSVDAPAAAAFAAGALAGMVRLDAQAARAEWPAVWATARRKKLRRWW